MNKPYTSAFTASLALVLLAGSTACSSDSSESSAPTIEPEYYSDVAVLQVQRNQAMGLCFEPNTAEDVIVDRTAGDGTVGGAVFVAGVAGQDECIDHNYPDDVCVVRVDLAATALTAAEATELESLVAAMPQGVCENDPNQHVDPCITTTLSLDGSRESSCLGGEQLVQGHGAALSALVGFIDELAISKLGR